MRRRVSKNGRKHQQQKVTQNNTLSKVGDTTSLHCKRCDLSLSLSLSMSLSCPKVLFMKIHMDFELQ